MMLTSSVHGVYGTLDCVDAVAYIMKELLHFDLFLSSMSIWVKTKRYTGQTHDTFSNYSTISIDEHRNITFLFFRQSNVNAAIPFSNQRRAYSVTRHPYPNIPYIASNSPHHPTYHPPQHTLPLSFTSCTTQTKHISIGLHQKSAVTIFSINQAK